MKESVAIEIIKESFSHLIFEEKVIVNNVEVALYFPTIGIAVVSAAQPKIAQGLLNDFDVYKIKKELHSDIVILDTQSRGFNLGHTIQDILLIAEFEPGDRALTLVTI